jgi:hypothetical protein
MKRIPFPSLPKSFVTWCALILAAVSVASAQDKQPLYAAGKFPAGRVYVESELQGLVGKSFSAPVYLIGRFAYLGQRHGVEVFSTFTRGLLNDTDIAFGRTLIGVKFFDNLPPGLTVGKMISATAENPLTVKSVRRSDDNFLLVQTESWSAP